MSNFFLFFKLNFLWKKCKNYPFNYFLCFFIIIIIIFLSNSNFNEWRLYEHIHGHDILYMIIYVYKYIYIYSYIKNFFLGEK